MFLCKGISKLPHHLPVNFGAHYISHMHFRNAPGISQSFLQVGAHQWGPFVWSTWGSGGPFSEAGGLAEETNKSLEINLADICIFLAGATT